MKHTQKNICMKTLPQLRTVEGFDVDIGDLNLKLLGFLRKQFNLLNSFFLVNK